MGGAGVHLRDLFAEPFKPGGSYGRIDLPADFARDHGR